MVQDTYARPVMVNQTGSHLTTVNTYVPIPVTGGASNGIFNIKAIKSKTIVLSSVTNNLKFQIEFSPDGTNWSVRLTDIVVNAAAWALREDIGNTELRGYWQYCRISVAPNVAATHGTGTFYFAGGTL